MTVNDDAPNCFVCGRKFPNHIEVASRPAVIAALIAVVLVIVVVGAQGHW